MYQNLQNSYKDLQDEYDKLQDSYSNLEKQHKDLQDRYDRVQAELSRLQAQYGQLQTSYSELEEKYYKLGKAVDDFFKKVEGKTITVSYRWRFSASWMKYFGFSNEWTWDIPIPLTYYLYYATADRPSKEYSRYVEMVKDPESDYLLDYIVRGINSVALKYGFTEKQKVEFTIAFIQSLPYVPDTVSASADEYPKYPAETLITNGGDCEDTSILAAALLRKMGYRVALIYLPHSSPSSAHMAVGIAGPFSGSYYKVGGVEYFYLETTGEGFPIGVIPLEIQDTRAYVYPVD